MIALALICLVPAILGTLALVAWAILALWPVADEATTTTDDTTPMWAWTTVLRSLRDATPRKAGRPAVRRIRLAWAGLAPKGRAGQGLAHTPYHVGMVTRAA